MESTFWFSLKEGINKKLRQADKNIPTICSVVGMLKILFLYKMWLLPFFSVNDAVYGITVEEISLERIKTEEAIAFLPDAIKEILAMIFTGKPPTVMIAPGINSQITPKYNLLANN